MNILYFITWLAGIIPAYFVIKWSFKKPGRIWTKMDRTLAVFIALFSWLAACSFFITGLIFNQKDLDKPSKW